MPLPEFRLSRDSLWPAIVAGAILFAFPKNYATTTLATLLGLTSLKRMGNYITGLDAFFTNNFGGSAAVLAVMELEGEVPRDVMKDIMIKELMNKSERFTQRIVRGTLGWSYAVKDKAFNLDDHVTFLDLPKSATREDVMAFASEHQNKPFDRTHPLWDLYFMYFNDEVEEEEEEGREGVQKQEKKTKIIRKTCLVYRFDHGLMDGVTIMRAFLKAADNEDLSMIKAKKVKERRGMLTRAATLLVETGRALQSAFFSPWDPAGPLKNKEYVERTNLAWSKPVSLKRVKYVANVMNVSVNDVLLACLSGMYGRLAYMRQEGSKTLPPLGSMKPGDIKDLRQLNFVMWVSLRGLDLHRDDGQMGNKIGCVYLPVESKLELPPVERLLETNRITTKMKNSVQPGLYYAIMNLLGCLPPIILKYVYMGSAFKATVSASNLPGPQTKLVLRGFPVSSLASFTRAQGTLGFFSLLVSYNGGVTVGISSDEKLLKREEMGACFDAYDEELTALEEYCKGKAGESSTTNAM